VALDVDGLPPVAFIKRLMLMFLEPMSVMGMFRHNAF
jgi:hypothetical protein